MKRMGMILTGAVLAAAVFSVLFRFGKDTEQKKDKPAAQQERHSLSVFKSERINEQIRLRINGKSLPADAKIAEADLRYLTVYYYGFDEQIHQGELIVNQAVADDILCVFQELLDVKYPIESIKLIDEYNAEDEMSMEQNNTSAFNYRVIAGTKKLSNHASGMAIDINPLYNPYVRETDEGIMCQPSAALPYANREQPFSYKITKGDMCYRIFEKYGFSWGGDWDGAKDYQHFEKIIDK